MGVILSAVGAALSRSVTNLRAVRMKPYLLCGPVAASLALFDTNLMQPTTG
jgi:hypothetical protein